MFVIIFKSELNIELPFGYEYIDMRQLNEYRANECQKQASLECRRVGIEVRTWMVLGISLRRFMAHSTSRRMQDARIVVMPLPLFAFPPPASSISARYLCPSA